MSLKLYTHASTPTYPKEQKALEKLKHRKLILDAKDYIKKSERKLNTADI